MNAIAPGFNQGLAGILDAIGTAVGIVVIRLAIRQRNQQLGACLHLAQQVTQVANGDPHAGVIPGLDAADAPAHGIIIGLIKAFHAIDLTTLAGHTGETINGITVAQCFQ